MSLQSFELDELAAFTPEGEFAAGASADFRVFLVGRDDVHSILMMLLNEVSLSLKLSMFGYDDEDLNAVVMKHIADPGVFVQVTLDRSQAGGVHESKILAADAAQDPERFASSIAIGSSETHQINHTKGAILDGIVAFEGSTNWSVAGEGTGINLKDLSHNPPGFKAQNNTLAVYTNPYEIAKFSARLDYEHAVARAQQSKK